MLHDSQDMITNARLHLLIMCLSRDDGVQDRSIVNVLLMSRDQNGEEGQVSDHNCAR